LIFFFFNRELHLFRQHHVVQYWKHVTYKYFTEGITNFNRDMANFLINESRFKLHLKTSRKNIVFHFNFIPPLSNSYYYHYYQ
jgi:hypothetical protein